MTFLNLEAYFTIVVFDIYMARRDFASLYRKVRNCPLGAANPAVDTVDRVCAAVNLACIWYWKEVLCLQRSAATTCLLRKYGVPAQMVIGAQLIPFKAHAWVEVDARVVNDKPYTPEIYAVLDRC